jgi:hypothetical protein
MCPRMASPPGLIARCNYVLAARLQNWHHLSALCWPMACASVSLSPSPAPQRRSVPFPDSRARIPTALYAARPPAQLSQRGVLARVRARPFEKLVGTVNEQWSRLFRSRGQVDEEEAPHQVGWSLGAAAQRRRRCGGGGGGAAAPA